MSIPDSWLVSTVGAIFSPVGGGTPNTIEKSYWGGRVPWVSSADIDQNFILSPRRFVTQKGVTNSSAAVVPTESVIVVTRVGLGKIGLVKEGPVCFSQDCQALLPIGGIDPRFTAYQMKFSAITFVQRSRGTTISGITKKQLDETVFRLPPSPAQTRIADALDELFSDLDAGVAALERVRVKLKLYRASVLKAAVEGALTAEWRAQHSHTEPAPELLKRILVERRRRWEEDELHKFKEKGQDPPKNWKGKYKEPVVPKTSTLPPLPDGWCWASIDQIASEVRNGHSKKPDADTGIPILRISAVRSFALDLEAVRYLSGDLSSYANSLIQARDLLFTRYNGTRSLVGVSAVVPIIDSPIVHPDKLIRARPLPLIEAPAFFALSANVGTSRAFIEQRIRTTAGQAGVSGGDIREVPVPLSPSSEQSAIVELVEDQLSVIDHLEADLDAKLKSAQALRQSILRHAFAGKLVPQDPNDEPASELLKRIIAERAARSATPDARKQSRPRKAGKASNNAAVASENASLVDEMLGVAKQRELKSATNPLHEALHARHLARRR